MDFLPPENTAMSNLLAIIKDPKSAEKRLNELNAIQADINSKMDASRDQMNAANQAKTEAEKMKAEAEALRQHNEEVTAKLHDDLQQKINTYDQSYRDHLTQMGKDIKGLDEQRQSLAQKEIELSQRETLVNNRELAVSVKEAEAHALQTEYGTRISKLKTIME